jgi:hypothetical protein
MSCGWEEKTIVLSHPLWYTFYDTEYMWFQVNHDVTHRDRGTTQGKRDASTSSLGSETILGSIQTVLDVDVNPEQILFDDS